MCQLSDIAEKNGYKAYKAVPYSRSNKSKKDDKTIFIGNIVERNIHLLLSKYTGLNGCFSHIGTYFFLRKVKKLNPDVIHLHNLHNSYINLSMLFKFIKKHNIKTIWTLHDCWSFTGKCAYFDVAKCQKWKGRCYDCKQLVAYPVSKVDKTAKMYKLKKKWFTGVSNMTIVTPSKWLANLVNESFLKDYPVKVINNGIDLNIFKPTESNFRNDNDLKDKFILLGVAFPWTYRKGYDIVLELSKQLDDAYRIVMVGLSKEQITTLPKNIIGIERTSSQAELAKIYSAADVFINPTREDNFPTVNMEALACGTPVITFNTGGSPESISKNCGRVVSCEDLKSLLEEVINAKNSNEFDRESCIEQSKKYNKNDKFRQYIDLFN